MAVNELADKAIKETMEFYTKYRVEYDFKKVCSAERETKPKLDQAKPYMHMMALSDSSWYLVECVAFVFACVRRCKAHVHRICMCTSERGRERSDGGERETEFRRVSS